MFVVVDVKLTDLMRWPSLRAWSYHCTFWVHQEQSWGCILMNTLMKWWITFLWNQALVDPTIWNALQKQLTVFLTSWLSWFANVGNAKANQGYSYHRWWTSQDPSICLPTAMPRAEVPPDDEWSQVMCNWFSKQRAVNQNFTLLFLFSLFGSRFSRPSILGLRML